MQLAKQLHVTYHRRQKEGLPKMFQRLQKSEAIVVTREGVRWQGRKGHHFFFHPSMSQLRVQAMSAGKEDPLVAVAGVRKGDHVLDCTLGLASDAIVSAVAVGDEGRVVGLESEPIIALLVEHGLKTYKSDVTLLEEAMRSIKVVCADYESFLARCPDRSFDLIFFDPMFRQTVHASAGMRALKHLAESRPLDSDAVDQAMRVARRRIVLKERRGSSEFARLGFRVVRESHTHALGIIDIEERRG